MSRYVARIAHIVGFLALVSIAGCGKSNRVEPKASGPPAAGRETAADELIDPTLTQVTLQLNWYPEAEHGGYYAALVHGYYQEAGLNVRIIAGGPETPVVQQVARRAVTFGIVNADNILFGRAQEAPVVAVMAPLQISPRCLIVHKSSGITGFDDLKNITLAMSNSNAFSHYLRYKLPLPGVKIVPYPGNVAQFLIDKHYAQQGYVFSEPFVARKEGGDPRVLMVSELGFNPYTSVLFTHDQQTQENPSLVHKMVTASIRGWKKYLEAPEAANKRIHEVNPEIDLDILEYGAETLQPLVMDGVAEQKGIGVMSRARWQTLADQLVESEQLKPGQAHVEAAFTTRFLQQEERRAHRLQIKHE
jgi:NitT/TauT family transport system substrate-binding protein